MDACREPVAVSGDPEELARVVDNMVNNAVKYTRPGGTVRVEVECEPSWTRESASTDTGMGISEADQAHLFSAFHRSSNPEALSIPGTGLGLAISRRIVESHGGDRGRLRAGPGQHLHAGAATRPSSGCGDGLTPASSSATTRSTRVQARPCRG